MSPQLRINVPIHAPVSMFTMLTGRVLIIGTSILCLVCKLMGQIFGHAICLLLGFGGTKGTSNCCNGGLGTSLAGVQLNNWPQFTLASPILQHGCPWIKDA